MVELVMAYRIFFAGMFVLGLIGLGTFLLQCWIFRDIGFPCPRFRPPKPPQMPELPKMPEIGNLESRK